MNNLMFEMLMNSRQKYLECEKEYVEWIENYLPDGAYNPKIDFNGNEMHLTFKSSKELDSKFISDFCDGFGFISSIIKFRELMNGNVIYEFVRIWD